MAMGEDLQKRFEWALYMSCKRKVLKTHIQGLFKVVIIYVEGRTNNIDQLTASKAMAMKVIFRNEKANYTLGQAHLSEDSWNDKEGTCHKTHAKI